MHWILAALIALFTLAGSTYTYTSPDPESPQPQGGGTSDPDG